MRLINKIKSILNPPAKKVMISSFSDNLEYPAFCMQASKVDTVFETFRRNDIYNSIVELLSEEQGAQFLNEINLNPEVLKEIDSFKENDLYGDPRMYDYKEVGKISPTTLMYTKILYDLQKYFGSLDGFDVVELGIGYGGQSRLLNNKFKINSTTLIDLEGPLALASKFLSNYNIDAKFDFKTNSTLEERKYDLFISNFAFTELRRNLQTEYLNKVILNSKRGYLIYNDINPEDFNSYKADELVELIPNSRIIAEVPLTSPKNCIIIWGDDIAK